MRDKNVAVDVGYGYVKVYDGENQYVIPSVVGRSREVSFRSNLVRKKLQDDLWVTLGDKSYFVGNLARQESTTAMRTLDESRINDPSMQILLLTGLSLVAEDDYNNFNIVTGLPPGQLARYSQQLEELLSGEHNISIESNGNTLDRSFTVNKVKILPQPYGTFYQQLYDKTGEMSEYKDYRVGVIDVGFKTTDLAVIDKLDYIDKLSTTFNLGLADLYGMVREYLRERFNSSYENFELDEIVRKASIRVEGKSYDLREAIEDALDSVSQKLVNEINSYWDTKQIDVLMLTGGGSVLLEDFILPKFANIKAVEDAQTANVRGYYRFANDAYESRW